MSANNERGGRTFIEEARRAQIIQCAVDVIAESGYARATMAEIGKRAGIAKSVISYHFADKGELMQELVRTAVATYTQFLEPRLAAQPTAAGKICAYVTGSAEYMSTYTNMHLAVLEVAFNGLGPDGRPLTASIPLETHKPTLERILHDGQVSGELRQFDVRVMAGLLRSAVTHTMVMAQRADPDVDLDSYARELATAFALATRDRP
ncbi:Transcriptional regulator, TetR family [Nostocoides japonicum T1-X7]|uniref:Transcriptional regulator, TetR family n=1 Tax=Nostocoides japonicum T1-X7 TaxID=1194083 RepID=A0A077M3Z2_9MICO|nr:TetR/AcrR family transcriptional regulator [Tetrasphaera japonica]CCH79777.1 Transcriptional regulator, TetR family [Tetrasphaera japonica T1-X7]